MEIIKRLQLEVQKGFSKSDLERIIDLPMNTLSSVLTGKKKMTQKQELLVIRFLDEHPNLNPLDYPKRTRTPKNPKKTGKLNEVGKSDIKNAPKIKVSELKNNQSPPPQVIKPEMPKGLSLTQQLEWREQNQ